MCQRVLFSTETTAPGPSSARLAALLLPPDEDELVREPAAPGAQTMGALAERSLRVLVADGRPSFASAVRVVTGVLGGSTNMRSPAELTTLARLAKLDELRLWAADLADGAPVALREEADLRAGQLHGHVLLVA